LAPEGAVPAARIAFSISSCGTGSGEKWRTERRSEIACRNARERSRASSSESRVKASGRGVYGAATAPSCQRANQSRSCEPSRANEYRTR
jgi:hypothetical protein